MAPVIIEVICVQLFGVKFTRLPELTSALWALDTLLMKSQLTVKGTLVTRSDASPLGCVGEMCRSFAHDFVLIEDIAFLLIT